MRILVLSGLVLTVACGALAQPVVFTVVNGASNILPGLPNAAVAQGAVFVAYGTGLGPASLVQASSFPLPTTLGGTSVQVTVSGTSVDAIMVYTLATQVAAILPSRTPVGTGTLKVTHDGQASAVFPITVTQSNVGLVTLNSRGSGDAVVTFPDYRVVAPNYAPNPGETVIFWATGLGPVTYDETRAPLGWDMTSVPLEVLVGGRTAAVLYHGRTGCCAGTDQINVTLPKGATGCTVPVVMRIGNLVSNTVTMPIAASGRQCTPSNQAISQSEYERWLAKGSFTAGGVVLSRYISTVTSRPSSLSAGAATVKSDYGSASFVKATGNPAAVFNAQVETPATGSCVLYTYSGQTMDFLAGLPVQGLDAGSAISISGPAGARSLTKTASSGLVSYSATLGDATPGNYLDPGTYTATGGGGADIGSFTAQHTLAPELAWTNQASITTVNRANGVRVTWAGGDPKGYIEILGTSAAIDPSGAAVRAVFLCAARTTDGCFSVPPAVLLGLPVGGATGTGGSSYAGSFLLGLGSVSYAGSGLQAAGLDFGYFLSTVGIVRSVAYE